MSRKPNAQKCQNACEQGRTARAHGRSKHTNPYGVTELALRHWWFSGWADSDIALKAIRERVA